jgi:serine protease Do
MFKRSISGWLVAIVFLGVLVGIMGGGVMGGVVGYYVALNRAPVIEPSAPGQLTVAQAPSRPPAVTNLSVTEDSAVIDTVKKSEPAVVTVINTLQRPSGQVRPGRGPSGGIPSEAEGSGVIIDDQGHIITNAHVVDGASQLDVIFADGTKTSAHLVGADSVGDIAVLQVSGNVPAFVPLGDSSAVQLGETVIAIGSPLGNYRGSVTVGVVSGLNRSVQGTGQEGLIQTDAAINHGNSGGPLLNLAGQVIGINTLVVRDTNSGDIAEGLGFAIPSNTVSTVVKQLIAQGKVQYPFIGITYSEITPQNAAQLNLSVQQGIVVEQVTPGSPAADAGIRVNDVITALDDTKIDQAHSLRSILFQHQAGDTVTLSVLRGGSTLSVKVTLTARPDQTNAGAPG